MSDDTKFTCPTCGETYDGDFVTGLRDGWPTCETESCETESCEGETLIVKDTSLDLAQVVRTALMVAGADEIETILDNLRVQIVGRGLRVVLGVEEGS